MRVIKTEGNRSIDDHTGSDIVCAEVERLTCKYGKEFFDCRDLMSIMGVGRDNARALMRSAGFPTTSVGNRKVVSAMSFVVWMASKDRLTSGRDRANM